MRILICGLGSIGRRHLRNLVALGEDDIRLLRTGRSTLPEADMDGFGHEGELGDALRDWAPDVVFVTNPTALHLDVAVPAARAGAHLFVEKPLSSSLERLPELERAVAASGVTVQVGYQFRSHPTLRRAQALLGEGVIGEPLSAAAHWGEYLPDWHPWEDYRRSYSARADLGGGVLLTLSHPLDYLRWLFGEVGSVVAEVGRPAALELDVEAQASVLLEHQSGVHSTVELNYHQRPPRHDLEVVGTEGTLRWDGLSGRLRWWGAGNPGWHEETVAVGFERNTMFVAELEAFFESIAGRGAPICTLDDGAAAVRIALAALESAGRGQRQVLRDPIRQAR
jgi:predicted dehydrogenase